LSDTPKDKKRYEEALRTAMYAYRGELPDITEGALWYHALTVKPWWAKSYKRTININDHIFYTRP
jgi:spore germination cell wall hydrolase CwlJ-like protein